MSNDPIHGLHTAAATAGDGAAVVAVFGALNSRAIPLINEVLNLEITSPNQHSNSKQRALTSSSPVAAAATSGGPIVLAMEGLDSLDRRQAMEIDKALGMIIGLAGVILVCVRQMELICPSGSALKSLMAAVEKSLEWRVGGIVSPLPQRRLILVAVRDFEKDVVEEAELQGIVKEYLADLFEEYEMPKGFAGKALDDVFDLRVVPVGGEWVNKEEYIQGVDSLAGVLKGASRQYVDAGMTVEGLVKSVERIWDGGVESDKADLPSENELKASFTCAVVMDAVLEKYRNTAKQWKTTVESGRIIRNFGRECDKLIEEILDMYEKEAAAHRGTKAFERKKEEMKSLMLGEVYVLFSKQIDKLKQVSYQVFRGKLARIRINDQVEKNVRGAVREAEMYFVENAESLQSKMGGWRFDNVRSELVSHMRDDATERLQLARLQGNYVPSIRAPIAFAFHTLLLAPFGRDSRINYGHHEEMQQKYDPDKVKQASLMRIRPLQRSHASVKIEQGVGQESLDMFSDLLGNGEE